MEGVYNVQENVNFENFLKVMGVTDEATIEKMINATKQVLLLMLILKQILAFTR